MSGGFRLWVGELANIGHVAGAPADRRSPADRPSPLVVCRAPALPARACGTARGTPLAVGSAPCRVAGRSLEPGARRGRRRPARRLSRRVSDRRATLPGVANELVNLPAGGMRGGYLDIAQVGLPLGSRQAGPAEHRVLSRLSSADAAGGRLLGGSTPQVVLAGRGHLLRRLPVGADVPVPARVAHPALGTTDRARRAVMLLGSYPFAVFYGPLYTEALFLAASLARSGTCGSGSCGGCRRGVLAGLDPRQRRVSQRAARAARRHGGAPGRGRIASACAPAFPRSWPSAAPGIGALLFSLFIYHLTGNPFEWAAIQERWGRTVSGGLHSIPGPFGYVAEHGLFEVPALEAPNSLNLAAAAFAAALSGP